MSGGKSDRKRVIDEAIRRFCERTALPRGAITSRESPSGIEIDVSEVTLKSVARKESLIRRDIATLREMIEKETGRKVNVRLLKYSGGLLAIEADLLERLQTLSLSSDVGTLILPSRLPEVKLVISGDDFPAAEQRGIMSQIAELARALLNEHGLTLTEVIPRFGAKNKPGRLTLLTTIKIGQPIAVEELHRRVIELGFGVDSVKWLSHQLDALRKDGLVLRSAEDSMYRLTQNGISVLPAAKGRTSTDVQRCLALARRRW